MSASHLPGLLRIGLAGSLLAIGWLALSEEAAGQNPAQFTVARVLQQGGLRPGLPTTPPDRSMPSNGLPPVGLAFGTVMGGGGGQNTGGGQNVGQNFGGQNVGQNFGGGFNRGGGFNFGGNFVGGLNVGGFNFGGGFNRGGRWV
jgi:hypothetical protein